MQSECLGSCCNCPAKSGILQCGSLRKQTKQLLAKIGRNGERRVAGGEDLHTKHGFDGKSVCVFSTAASLVL